MLAQGCSAADTACMDTGAAAMTRTPTRPVQVRLPGPVDDFHTGLAHERGESKTQIVQEALECLRQQLLARQFAVPGLHAAREQLLTQALERLLHDLGLAHAALMRKPGEEVVDRSRQTHLDRPGGRASHGGGSGVHACSIGCRAALCKHYRVDVCMLSSMLSYTRRCIHPVAAQKNPSSTSVLPAAETRCRWPDPSTTRLQLSASDTPFVVDATGPTYEKGGYD